MKFKKISILLIFILIATISGCEINLYNPNKDQSLENNNGDLENIHLINPSNFNGTYSYAPLNQQELSTEDIYKLRISSTVYIISSTLEHAFLGSGVFFSEDTSDDGYAYIFTNAHLVENAIKIEIVYSNYKRDSASLVGYHLLEDIAILKVKKNDNYTIPTLQTSDKLEVSSKVITIGTPVSTNYSFSSTSGVISKIDSPITSGIDPNYNLLLLQIDATLNSGNSGGPLFDKYGNLIGLNTMKLLYDNSFNSVDDFNFSIPIDRAIFIANKIFNNIKFEKGTLGVTIIDIVDLSLSEREDYNIKLDYGLYVSEVSQDSDSYNKIFINDIIVKINGIDIKNKTLFQKEIFKFAKDEIINITIYRNNEYQDINITLK